MPYLCRLSHSTLSCGVRIGVALGRLVLHRRAAEATNELIVSPNATSFVPRRSLSCPSKPCVTPWTTLTTHPPHTPFVAASLLSLLSYPPPRFLPTILATYCRYPRSAARAVRACARRHAVSRGGVNSCPFPVYAGDLTHIIGDLLSLPPPVSTSGGHEETKGSDSSSAAFGSRDMAEAEPMDLCSLRLAALPTWPLLDAPNAFQEAFAMAVLIMEVGLAAGTRDHNPLRVSAVCIVALKMKLLL